MEYYDYHNDNERIGKSGLDLIHDAPIKYYLQRLWEKRVPFDTKAMKLGRYYHTVLFEPHRLDLDFYIFKEKNKLAQIGGSKPRSTNDYKAWLAQEIENAGHKTMVPDEIAENQPEIYKALMRNPLAKALVEANGHCEYPIKWTSENGALMKSKLDKLILDFVTDMEALKDINDCHVVVDYKTCEEASPIKFRKSIHGYRYDVQGAMYTDAVAQLMGDGKRVVFVMIAQEKKFPYLTELHIVSDEDNEKAREEYLEDCATYLSCMEVYKKTSDPLLAWHGYSKEPKLNLTFLPTWER
jgi:exodeoxyribonuclease VIII